MSTTPHLGVFGIQFASASSAYSDSSLAWLFGNAPGSFVSFFRDCSGGAIDIGGAEVVNVAPDPTDIGSVLDPRLDRRARLQALCEVVMKAGAGDLRRFDGLVFGCFGLGIDCGMGSIYTKGKWIPAAIFDELSPHNMVCHEIGHVVGLDHSYRLQSNTGFLYGEYGDPTDVMSSSGARPGAAALPADPFSDIAPTGKLWTAAGPGISLATLWRYLKGFPAAQPWVQILDAQAPEATYVLERAGAPWTGRPALIALPGAGGWWTVEYRGATGWDRALTWEPQDVTHSPGLVIHRIGDLGTAADGPSYPRRQQVQYVATIPVPSGGDDDWDNGQFGVRFHKETPTGVRVSVGRALSGQPSVRIDVAEPQRGRETRVPVGMGYVPLTGPDCTGSTFTMERADAPVVLTIETRASGFATARMQYEVNGVPVGTAQPSGVGQQGTMTLPSVPVSVPVGRFEGTLVERSITVSWQTRGHRLRLELPAGDGRYELPIRVKADQMGSDASWEAATAVTVTTSSIELSPEAQASLVRCIRKLTADATRLRVQQRGRPRPVEPIDGPDWSSLDARSLFAELEQLAALERRSPFHARVLRERIADGLGVHPGELLSLSEQFEHNR